MVQHLTGGNWALVIRRILEAGSRTLPLMAVAVLPLLAGMKWLYSWSRPGQTDSVILSKHLYLNPVFSSERRFLFCVLVLLVHLLNKWSRNEDAGGNASLWARFEGLSGGGLVLYGFTVTFASVDWVMSLEPRWYSTIYGMLFIVGQALAALAFSIMALIRLSSREPLSQAVRPSYFQDLGSFLLAFVMLWAYLEFSQFLIIWAETFRGNSVVHPALQGTWGESDCCSSAEFALPFFLLLFRNVKRRQALCCWWPGWFW